MERSESVGAAEQSCAAELETVTKGNCSPTKSSLDVQHTRVSATSQDSLQDASGPFANKVAPDKCCSDKTDVQRVSRQTSELQQTSLGTDFVQMDNHAKTAQPVGSVLQLDARRRAVPYNFVSTRHESYGNLGIAGLAGLSSTSATLALLPLQASAQCRTTTVPSRPVTTSPVTTSTPPLVSTTLLSGTTSLDLPEVVPDGKPRVATGDMAASVRDRRSTFFSEPPKPVSLPTRSASELCSLCDEALISRSLLPTNMSSRGSKESNGPSISATSVPRNLSGSFTVLSTTSTLVMPTSPPLLSRSQQQHVVLASDSLLLCPEMPHSVSAHDVSPAQCSDQSTASDSECARLSVWCGPPPDDTTALSAPVSVGDTCIFDIGTI